MEELVLEVKTGVCALGKLVEIIKLVAAGIEVVVEVSGTKSA